MVTSQVKEQIEKLLDTAIEEAKEEIDKLLLEAEKDALKNLEKAYIEDKKRALEGLEKAKRKAEVEAKKLISSADIKAKHLLLKVKGEILNQILKSTLDKFRDTIGEEKYEKFIEKLFTYAITSIGSKELNVDVSKHDVNLIRKIIDKKSKEYGVTITLAKDLESKGGFIVYTPDGRSRIDFTLESIIESLKDNIKMKVSKAIFGE